MNSNKEIDIKTEEIIPLINLPIIYGFIDISVLEIVLHTCKRTHKPLNPNKNDVGTSLEKMDELIDEISLMPVVISRRPYKK